MTKILTQTDQAQTLSDQSDNSLSVQAKELEAAIIKALRTIYDPEIPVNIYDLGLIYHVTITDENVVHIQMTLTTPGCPVAATFPQTVEQRVKEVPDVTDVTVELVWDPPWTNEKMSEAAKLALGLL